MRAIKMNPSQLHEFTNNLIAQQNNYRTSLLETAAYSNGSFTYEDLLKMPTNDFSILEKIIVKKLKQDRGVKEQSML